MVPGFFSSCPSLERKVTWDFFAPAPTPSKDCGPELGHMVRDFFAPSEMHASSAAAGAAKSNAPPARAAEASRRGENTKRDVRFFIAHTWR